MSQFETTELLFVDTFTHANAEVAFDLLLIYGFQYNNQNVEDTFLVIIQL